MTNSQWSALLGALIPFLYIATIALLVTILALAHAVFIPVALAVLLSFILTPGVRALERRGLPRLGAVALVMVLTLGVVGGFGYVLSRQFNDFATQFPRYSNTIKQKLATLRASQKGILGDMEKAVEQVSEELAKQEAKAEQKDSAKRDEQLSTVKPPVQPVQIIPSEPTNVERFREIAVPIFEQLATVGIVLILTMFMLVQREDLRNRFLRLVGHGKITLTTRTMDEAGQRISRFLLTQSLINSGFGVVVAAVLFWIDLPYAVLWGVSAALLRFVPYLGSLLAMLLPTALAFVLFPGWSKTFMTVGLFLTLDGVTANVIEPLLIGHRTGVSSLALLVSAIFWTWLWGPVGLVLSTPLTVCLAVIGKHVPRLEFLAVLLGDEPALEADVSFYQRLLAGDEDEASEIIEQQLQTTSLEQVFDEVLVPSLLLAERDRAREEISDNEEEFVLRAIRDVVHHLIGQTREEQAPETADTTTPPVSKPQGYILGVPARSRGAELVLDMLSQVLRPVAEEVVQLSTATLGSEVLAVAEQRAPDLICIVAMPPGGLTQARYLCKRIRSQFPKLQILVVRPGFQHETTEDRDRILRRLTTDGVNTLASSLTEARTQAVQLLVTTPVQRVEPESAPEAVELTESVA